MNARIKRTLNMLKRVARFLADNVITPAIPRATTALTEVATTITDLETAAVKQTSGSGQAGSGAAVRRQLARELRKELMRINLTAHEMESEVPGISEKFKMPRPDTYAALKATAQNAIDEATPISAEFVSFGLPATFLTDLEEKLTAFETATDEKYGGINQRKVGTVSLEVKATLGVAAVKRLNACVRNHFRAQAEIIEAWAAARRIEASPVRENDEENPPSGDPGSGGGGTLATEAAGRGVTA